VKGASGFYTDDWMNLLGRRIFHDKDRIDFNIPTEDDWKSIKGRDLVKLQQERVQEVFDVVHTNAAAKPTALNSSWRVTHV